MGYNYHGNVSYCISMSENLNSYAGASYGRAVGTEYGGTLTNNLVYEDMVIKANYLIQNIKDTKPVHTSKQGLNTAKSKLYNLNIYTLSLEWDLDTIWKLPASGTEFPILRNMIESLQKPVYHRGSKQNPHLIYTEKDLKDITENGLDQYYKLMDDITIQSEQWTMIGTSAKPFIGELDGNGYQIKNLKMASDQGKGLFGWIYGATIKNLKIINCELTGGGNYAGGIAAYANGSNLIKNCYVSGTINGTSYVGGIVGYINQGHMIHCQNQAIITTNGYHTGGIAGQSTNKALIEECSNLANINGAIQVGGITGTSDQGSVITNTYNRGDVTGISNCNIMMEATGWISTQEQQTTRLEPP